VFPYPHWAAGFLDNPIRRLIDRPAAVVDRLALTGAERVVELGPGPGFYSTEIARRVPQGQLDLFDIQPEMLDRARRNLEDAGCRNVGYHAGDASRGFPFPDGQFDVAFLAAVLGEVPDKWWWRWLPVLGNCSTGHSSPRVSGPACWGCNASCRGR
jgi:protein-L-isoaspartate O-methyltransferase